LKSLNKSIFDVARNFVYAFSNKNMVYIVYLIIIIDNAPEISKEKCYISGYGLFYFNRVHWSNALSHLP